MSALTPAQKRALTWIAANEPVSMFPCDGSGASLRFTKQLEKRGLVERVGKTAATGGFLSGGFTQFALTDHARSLLAKEGETKIVDDAIAHREVIAAAILSEAGEG